MSDLQYIMNPVSNKKVSIYSKQGKNILNKYLSMIGGHEGPCALNGKTNRCKKSKIGDNNCKLEKGKCVKAKPAKAKPAKAKPTKAKPAKAKPTKAKPVKAKPTKAKPAKAKPAKAKPTKAKPTKAKPVKAKPKAKPVKVAKPKAKPVKVAKPIKTTTTKTYGKTKRLSARAYYDRHGKDGVLGDRCDVRKNAEYKCLLKRVNGSPYWAKKSKTGKGQEDCGNWRSKCKENEFQ